MCLLGCEVDLLMLCDFTKGLTTESHQVLLQRARHLRRGKSSRVVCALETSLLRNRTKSRS